MPVKISLIYLLQDARDQGTQIYKIGRTTQKGPDNRIIHRFKDYSAGTTIHEHTTVPNELVNVLESTIILAFDACFRRVRGKEWFEGDVYTMKAMMSTIINHEMEAYKHSKMQMVAMDESIETDSQGGDTGDVVHGDRLYEVESILAHTERKLRSRTVRKYLIKWKGYDASYNTWEPEQNLTNCAEILGEYWAGLVSRRAQNRAHCQARRT